MYSRQGPDGGARQHQPGHHAQVRGRGAVHGQQESMQDEMLLA